MTVSTPITALFFDIDGTLTSFKTSQVPASTRAAISACREQGIKASLATGRSPHEYEAVKKVLGMEFDGTVCMTGQVAYDERGYRRREPLDQGDVRLLLDYLKTHPETGVHFSELEYGYLNFLSPEAKKLYDSLKDTAPSAVIDDPYERTKTHELYQFSIYLTAERAVEVTGIFHHTRALRWHKDFADFIPADGGKDKGIAALLDSWGLKRENCMVFGDGENDIDMIDYAGIGVAMGNASDLVKSHADYVTSSVDEDGIYRALQHFGVLG